MGQSPPPPSFPPHPPPEQGHSCRFCGRTVIDGQGRRTEDYGTVRHGRHYICARCMRAFEFSLGG